MNESVSYTFLLNIIITFILVSFAVLMGTLSYTKAYRVNSKIANAIEICEGYNSCSQPKINNILKNYGYQKFNVSCTNGTVVNATSGKMSDSGICVYETDPDGNKHYSYDVYTYMYFDFPIINAFRVPVRAKTDRIYKF